MGTDSVMVEGTVEHGAARRLRVRAAVSHARLTLLGVAGVVGACDLIVKLLDPTEAGLYHKRTYGELVLMLTILVAAVYFVPLTRSRSTAVGAGLMVGGGLGNALSIIVSPLGVPNPFVVSEDGWTIAFNFADLCVVAGCVLLMLSVWGIAVGRNDELYEPVER